MRKLTDAEVAGLEPNQVVHVRYTTHARGLYQARILAIGRTLVQVEHGQRTSTKRVQRWVRKTELFAAPEPRA